MSYASKGISRGMTYSAGAAKSMSAQLVRAGTSTAGRARSTRASYDPGKSSKDSKDRASYDPGAYSKSLGVLTPAQVNARMGWTPSRLRSYWDARARACQNMGDEGACLARVARHRPVTLGNYEPAGGLGQTPADVANIVTVAGRLISAPDATMRAQGPAIVAAVDQHLLAPIMNVAVQRAMPYVIRYMGPPLVVLYLLSGMATYFSFEVLSAQRQGLLKNSRRRKRRRSRGRR